MASKRRNRRRRRGRASFPLRLLCLAVVIAAFLGARLGTGLLDMLIMYLCVDLLGWNDMVMKLASNVIVVILNYILSKFFIFKKKEK